MIVINLALFILGLYVLIKGSDWLVDGSTTLATKLRINPIVIGLTIVAFGTSAPELIVSITAAINGDTQIALSNVVGSNITNILLILGLSAFIKPINVLKNTTWKEIPLSLLAAISVLVLGLQNVIDGESKINIIQLSTNQIGNLTLSNGLILIFLFTIFLYYTYNLSKTGTVSVEFEVKKWSTPISLAFVALGLVALGLGSRLIVDNATSIALQFGVSTTLIGLTIVALGTSLPELVTSVVAARKGNSDIAIGNVVGSNIFNLLLILPVTIFFNSVPLNGQNLQDLVMLVVTTTLLFVTIFIFTPYNLGRKEGATMLGVYLAYNLFLFWRG